MKLEPVPLQSFPKVLNYYLGFSGEVAGMIGLGKISKCPRPVFQERDRGLLGTLKNIISLILDMQS